jgi:hypothetical protein
MRARVLLPLSLGLNILLAGMIIIISRQMRPRDNPVTALRSESPSITKVKTNVVIRRKGFQWSEIESTNYPVFIRNLRLIGCPERTIRDIIVADVDDLYVQRIRNEVVIPEQEWWKADPNQGPLAVVGSQIQLLNEERIRMLDQLLGSSWRSNTVADVATLSSELIRLDGPVLSKLSPHTKASLLQIEESSRQAREDYLAQMTAAGKTPDPVALARMRQQVRNDLATLLTPDQLEEYLLRYSNNADGLRQELRGFGADADEFRRIFRARDGYDLQLTALDPNDPASSKRKSELERMRDHAVEQVIGQDRFKLYRLTQEPSFIEARQSAVENGIAPEKVLPMVEINKAAEQELARIQLDATLSAEEQEAAIKVVLDQKRASIEKLITEVP